MNRKAALSLVALVGLAGTIVGFKLQDGAAPVALKVSITNKVGPKPGWAGLILKDVFDRHPFRKAIGEGVLVCYVFPGSPADKAGVKALDLVGRIDGREGFGTLKDVYTYLNEKKPGDKVTFTLLHAGAKEASEIEMTIGALPEQVSMEGF
jgi:S1-C subfamily serine protease